MTNYILIAFVSCVIAILFAATTCVITMMAALTRRFIRRFNTPKETAKKKENNIEVKQTAKKNTKKPETKELEKKEA